jgi:hypothetical protein
MDEALPDVGRLQQGLGGDAAHQQAGAAQSGLLLDERGLQSVLAGANGCGVAAGTTPDNDQIVGHFFHSTCAAACSWITPSCIQIILAPAAMASSTIAGTAEGSRKISTISIGGGTSASVA